ncbi:MAG: hypothetical protein LPJ89_03085 [Hymenobacteraceae bacterium]|nr:hypothetical protein [Hymenobacteraceae bacterium]MDX5395315.1 hypothetical protein [Hymenobacteraceae bacterium]MDX5442749.1 hypothetical protein [Hymenobacteraceae bacterium]MDX5511351.1 hypothetical protein [Hymenobacteraceae bacterium]
MPLLAFAVPVLPGKTDQWMAMTAEARGNRNNAYRETRRKQGIRERCFLQHTPNGDFVIVTLEGENPQKALQELGKTDDDFTRWFVQQVEEIHGFNLKQANAIPVPELMIDSGEDYGQQNTVQESIH